jgi:hypothetical protein
MPTEFDTNLTPKKLHDLIRSGPLNVTDGGVPTYIQ